MKLSDAEEEELEEAERRKPWLGELASSSYSTSTRETNAHLDTIAEDIVRTKEIKCGERSRVGGGSDVGGLYGPEDYGMNPRRTNGKRQSSRFLPSAMKGISRIEMRGINALNLQPAVPSSSFQPQRCQPKRQPLARVDEHKAENRDRRSRDSEVKSQEVEGLGEEVSDDGFPDLSDSASAASSAVALDFLQCALFSREDDSSENEPPESEAPTCPSLAPGSDVENESVGSSATDSSKPWLRQRKARAQAAGC